MSQVLIAEHNDDVGRALLLMVEHFGYKPYLVTNGKAAVMAVSKIRPAVVLMEIALPDIDGCEAARLIRAEQAQWAPTMIALTALGRPQDIERSKAAGMRFHLVKPVDAELLRAALDSLASPLH